MSIIYADANAGARCSVESFPAGLTSIVNPSSAHLLGQQSRNTLETARESIAALLGVQAEKLLFVSSVTEGVLFSLFTLLSSLRQHHQDTEILIVYGAGQHPVARDSVDWLSAIYPQVQVKEISVDPYASPNWNEILDVASSYKAVLIHAQYAHSETGAILNTAQFKQICTTLRERCELRIHIDAAQVLGKVPSIETSIADIMTFSGNKIGAPAGLAFCYAHQSYEGQRALLPGNQEWRRRGGTENVLGAVLLAQTLAERLEPMAVSQQIAIWRHQTIALRERLHADGRVQVLSAADSLANTTFLLFNQMPGHKLVMALGRQEIYVSQGTACRSGIVAPNETAVALGFPPELAHNTLRISFDWHTNPNSGVRVAEAIIGVLDAV